MQSWYPFPWLHHLKLTGELVADFASAWCIVEPNQSSEPLKVGIIIV